MTKDELKNRISMALKDPILQQGFEIICKNLAELEKELKLWTDTKEARETIYFQQKQKIADLEKENAEQKDQLTEAKEIIKDLLRLPYANDWEVCGDVTSYLDKAEQFLKGDRKMKDEELFKAWKSEQYKDQSTEERFEFVEHLHTFPKYFEQAFFAGHKAQPKWHILAEESDVLPEEGQKVKVLTEEGNIENSTYFYDTYYEEFAWSNIGLLKVFAWCELPTFDKE